MTDILTKPQVFAATLPTTLPERRFPPWLPKPLPPPPFTDEQIAKWREEFEQEKNAVEKLLASDAFKNDLDIQAVAAAMTKEITMIPNFNILTATLEETYAYTESREIQDGFYETLDRLMEKDMASALVLRRWMTVQTIAAVSDKANKTAAENDPLPADAVSAWKAARTQLDQSPKSFEIATEFLADSQLEPKQGKAVFRQKLMGIVSDMCLEEEVWHFSAQNLNHGEVISTNNKAMDVLIAAGMEADKAGFAVAGLRLAANAKTKPLAQRGNIELGG